MSVTLETCDKLRLDAAYTTAKSVGCKYSSVAKSLVFQKLILEVSIIASSSREDRAFANTMASAPSSIRSRREFM